MRVARSSTSSRVPGASREVIPSRPLSAADRVALLGRARGALERRLCGRRAGARLVTERLERPGAAFVSIYSRGGALRGCRGRLHADRPLGDAVEQVAVAAALRDPRFPPVTRDELPDVKLVVHVLTPPRVVAGPDRIELGRHGIVLTKGAASALFLPDVATDLGWDLPTTLAQLCRKAGLPADAWRRGATFEVFESATARE